MKARRQIEDLLWNELIRVVVVQNDNQVEIVLLHKIKVALRTATDTGLTGKLYRYMNWRHHE